jgi:hypothetical protein
MSSRFLVLAIAAVGVAGLGSNRASAHDLQGRVKLPSDAVIVEAWFSDDTPAQGAKVTIADASGKEVAFGKTDDTGVCRLPKLGAGKYTATVDLIGHRDAIEFEVAESSSGLEFYNWRLNKTLGLTAGVVGFLSATCAFWFFRRRKSG